MTSGAISEEEMKYIIDNPKSLDPDSYTLMITKNNKEK